MNFYVAEKYGPFEMIRERIGPRNAPPGKRSAIKKKNGLVFAVLRRFCIALVYFLKQATKSPTNGENAAREVLQCDVPHSFHNIGRITSKSSFSVPVS